MSKILINMKDSGQKTAKSTYIIETQTESCQIFIIETHLLCVCLSRRLEQLVKFINFIWTYRRVFVCAQ